jgi:hypothetical protein
LVQIDKAWDSLSQPEKTGLLHSLVAGIEYDGSSVTINFHADGIRSLVPVLQPETEAP